MLIGHRAEKMRTEIFGEDVTGEKSPLHSLRVSYWPGCDQLSTSGSRKPDLDEDVTCGLPVTSGRGSRLVQRIRGLWGLCGAIEFCECFRDYFCPAVLTRLFDDADYVLLAHPHRAVRLVLYAISV